MLAMASSSVFADTYFRVGLGESTSDASLAKSYESIKEGKLANSDKESLTDSSFSTQSIMLAAGAEFNHIFGGEIRYYMGASSKIDDAGSLSPVSDNSWSHEYKDVSIPSLTSPMKIEETNRFEGLLVLRIPTETRIYPYAFGGYSMANIKAGNSTFNANGITYGAGLNFKMDQDWSVSLEYQIYPELNDNYVESFDMTGDETTNPDASIGTGTGTGTGSKDSNNYLKVSNFIQYEGSRVGLVVTYAF